MFTNIFDKDHEQPAHYYYVVCFVWHDTVLQSDRNMTFPLLLGCICLCHIMLPLVAFDSRETSWAEFNIGRMTII